MLLCGIGLLLRPTSKLSAQILFPYLIAWTLLKVLRGRFREVNWMVYLLTALFITRFWYMGKT